jgi:hypothetical protein
MSAENSGAQEASSSRHLRARGNWSRRAIGALLVSATVSCNQRAAPSGASGDLEWGTVSGELTGTRYSPAPIISRANVKHLRRVWVQRTGDWPIRVGEQFPADRTPTRASAAALPSYRFETTAVMHHRMLFVATPFNRVIALDPSSGAAGHSIHALREARAIPRASSLGGLPSGTTRLSPRRHPVPRACLSRRLTLDLSH